MADTRLQLPSSFIDVQPFLHAVCGDMALDELVHGDHFSLHDAMMAIEIGDPRMDVGMRRGEKIRTLAQRIAANEAPNELPPGQLLAVIDRLMAMEVTWMLGAMLPQTVFTSIYVLDTTRLDTNAVLEGFAKAMRCSCTLLHTLLVRGLVCDEEDIPLHTFGVQLDPPGRKCVRAAQDALRRGIDSGFGASYASALASRLQFRSLVLQVLELLLPPTAEEDLLQAATLCHAALKEMDTCKGTELPEEALVAAPGFAADINHRAMGLVPPREVNVASLARSLEYWKRTLEGLSDMCGWLSKCRSWQDLRDGLVSRVVILSDQPIVRSVLHGLLSQEKTYQVAYTDTVTQPPWTPSQRMIAAEFGWSSDGPTTDSMAALFLEQCTVAAQGWCHLKCMNIARQRGCVQPTLTDWRNISDHALNAEASPAVRAWFQQRRWAWQDAGDDGNPSMGPLAAWVEHETAWTLLHHLMLGFPLELYAPHEYVSVYCYCDYLLGATHGALREFERMKAKPRQASKHGSTRGPSTDDRRNTVRTLTIEIERMMCQGLLRAAIGLSKLGLISAPKAPLNSARERYHQRFGAFGEIYAPPPFSYDEYVRIMDFGKGTSPEQVLLIACDAFAKAQSAVALLRQLHPAEKSTRMADRLEKHLKGISRIAMQNLTALKLVMTGLLTGEGGSSRGKVSFHVGWDFKVALQHSTEMFYPSIVLKTDTSKKMVV